MGNWKMNLGLGAAVTLAEELADSKFPPTVDVVLIPSPVHLHAVADRIRGSGLELGAQDCSPQSPGAFTGGTSAAQLAEFGTRWVLVGHSERRSVFGENDPLLAEKFAAVRAEGLAPVLCVGETLEERDAGRTGERVLAQLEGAIDELPPVGAFCIAYEPVWAIGTGRNAELADVVEVHRLIRSWLADHGSPALAAGTPILYGGSVNEANAGEYLGHEEIDGALVGGASLDAARFRAIGAAAV
jgi:triosephosphate isomerase